VVKVGANILPIYNFTRPQNENYIVYQILGMPNGKNFTVIKVPANYSLEIGKKQSEINIPDLSVSEEHGFIKYDDEMDELILSDNNSHKNVKK
jgi:hypothetical protein